MMDARSELNLVKVHPALCNVIRGAAQTPQPFEVIQGLRSFFAEQKAVRTGRSTTMHSRHLANHEGFACAVDVIAMINGHGSFAEGHEAEVFGKIWAQIQASARALNVPIEWGGNWRTIRDFDHFQLPWASYP